MKIYLTFFTSSLIWLISSLSLMAEKEIKVLIVDGFGNHDWKATTEAISKILDSSFIINVSSVPKEKSELWEKWQPAFHEHDVVIQNTNDISRKGSWPPAAQKALEDYVHGGGGLFIFHSANNAFPKWEQYNEMIGLGWRKKSQGRAIIIEDGKPVFIPVSEGENTGHGPRVNTLIHRLNAHPINEGMPEKWMAADLEVYRYARGPANNLTVLSYAYEEQTKLHFPVEWVVSYGEGRVYNSTLGHYWHKLKEVPEGFRCIGFRTLLPRATRWLAGVAPQTTIPKDFPTENETSLTLKE